MTSWEHKIFQWRQLLVHGINGFFQFGHILFFQLRQLKVIFLGVARQVGTDGKQVVLDLLQQIAEIIGHIVVPDNSHEAVELVNGAIGFNAEMVLGDAGPSQKGSLTLVSFFGVNLHERSIGEFLLLKPFCGCEVQRKALFIIEHPQSDDQILVLIFPIIITKGPLRHPMPAPQKGL